jgi:signal transduction histidine kinase
MTEQLTKPDAFGVRAYDEVGTLTKGQALPEPEAQAHTYYAHAALDVLPMQIAILGRDGAILSVNRAWRDFMATNGGDATRCGEGANYLRVCQKATGPGAEGAAVFAAGLRAVLAGNRQSFALEYPCHAPDQQRWFSARVSRLSGAAPAIAMVAHEDITARVLAEQRCAEAAATRDDFLSVTAHELKTPITSLRAAAQLLLRQIAVQGAPDPQRLALSLHIINQQSERLAQLVAHVLDSLRGDAQPLDRQWTDLTALAQRVLAQVQAGTARHTLRLRARPGVMAVVDARKLEQTFMNLVANAVKYSPQGGPVECEVATPVADEVRISVRDHGIGVPPEQRRQLFERFYQAQTHRHMGGVGLGLSTAKQIVALHGGTIEAQFPDDGGARFIIRLPLNPS